MPDPVDPKNKRRHTLADHAYGQDYAHTHDGDDDADHDHDSFNSDGAIEENPIWIQDHVSLASVGIDIGSAGTQVIFSRLHLRRFGEELSSRYYVVARETLYQSPVALTPYMSEELIDAEGLGAIIDAAYNGAGVHPDNIDTGVVILTGEALRRENAQAIAGVIAEQGGEFVCATAGHHMEAMLASYGSGAAKVSHDTGRRILNIDIGGGTTKLAVVENGRVIATAAVHVGGRLQVVDADQRIVRLDPAGKYHAAQAGFSWGRGDIADPGAMDCVAESMADALVAAVVTRPLPHAIENLYLTEPICDFGRIDGIMFSGGVGEYVYRREDRDFGDLGKRLGRAVRRRVDSGALPWPLLPAGECMRATALGASEYSVQLSGNTTCISDPGVLLPRKNLQVLQPPFVCGEAIDTDQLAGAIRAHFSAFDRVEGAKTLGAILREELGVKSELLVIDGVTLQDFDYIDLGRIRMPSQTVPVTVKSLVFSEDPRAPHKHPHLHHEHRHHEHDPDHGHHHHDHDHHHPHTHGHEHGPHYIYKGGSGGKK